MSTEFTFAKIQETDTEEIATLLKHLWSGDQPRRLQQLKWKYFSLPNSEACGIVARHQSKIVGFRGLIPSAWQMANNTVKFLFIADAVVDPNYRGNKLLERMNIEAMNAYSSSYQYFIMASSNPHSAYIYKKQGADRFLTCTYKRKFFPLNRFFKRNISVDNQLNSATLDKILKEEQSQNKMVMLDQKKYYQWKLNEPGKKIYIEEATSSYLIFEFNGKQIEILDFGFSTSTDELTELIDAINRKFRPVSMIWPVYGQSNKMLIMFLENKGFSDYALLKKMKKNMLLERALLIRPVKNKFDPEEWNLNGKDLRNGVQWSFKHIYYV